MSHVWKERTQERGQAVSTGEKEKTCQKKTLQEA